MQFTYKRLFIPISLVLLFLLAACGSAPLSKEEANELKEAEEQSEVRGGTFHEKLDDDIGTSLNKSSIGKETNSDGSSEENNEPDPDESTEVANETERKESGQSDLPSEDEVAHQDQPDDTTTLALKEKTKSESKSTKSNQSDKQKSESKEEKKQPKEKSSSSSQPSKNEEEDQANQPSEPSESNQEDQKKDNPPSEESTKKGQTIVHSIVISDSEVPLPPTEMEIKDGFTVLNALIKITKAHKIQMDYRGGQGATAYVEGIANVYEFDRGSGSGWMYRVNGIFPDRGAGVVPLRPGDRVEWLYTTNLGQDLGADLKPFRR